MVAVLAEDFAGKSAELRLWLTLLPEFLPIARAQPVEHEQLTGVAATG
jgi:hypothetical protein